MSAHLRQEAAAMAGFAHGFRRQMFNPVPPIPADITLAGKTVLVTGSNAGLGLECARHFLALGASLLVMAVRSLPKGEAAAEALRAEFPDGGARIEVWELNMASFRSVRAFAERCGRELPQGRLHAAVLNAGLGAFEFRRVGEGRGRETMLQVNYLASALLALLLLPLMKPSPTDPVREPGRLTLISSDAALTAPLSDPGEGNSLLDSLDRAEAFDGFAQYGVSKLLLTMFVAKLATGGRFVSADDVVVNVSNPGPTRGTQLVAQGPLATRLFTGVLFGVCGRSAAEAARIYVHSNLVLGRGSHGGYTDWLVRAWPPMMYTEEGRRLGDKLWDETMKELSFAKVEELLEGLKR
ncbi:short-chain dehydrogenase/reductase family protein [Apiospora marii]|uniref:short-chain dehydrogenase/reductase family protein n=1 Tax=Apiospora marii TaxID=335849 RepID=UPI003131FCDA